MMMREALAAADSWLSTKDGVSVSASRVRYIML